MIAFVHIYFPTCGSKALNGSSSKYISASLYSALASEILALCPPESVTPLLPTTVWSPSEN